MEKVTLELKPCPFCGGKAKRMTVYVGGITADGENHCALFEGIACEKCHAGMKKSSGWDETVKTWNARVDEHHAKSRTIEDVLDDYRRELVETWAYTLDDEMTDAEDEITARYADKLRGMK